jgi:hypothetical protein
VVDAGYRWEKDVAQPEFASAGAIPPVANTSEDAASRANRTVRVDHIGMYSWTAGERARM